MCFLFPRWLWKTKEDQLIETFTDGLNELDESTAIRTHVLIGYLKGPDNGHDLYFIWYYLSELLNFNITAVNIFVIDYMLGGAFLSYGVDVLAGLSMENVLPRMTKCQFLAYGRYGGLFQYDAICLLPVNELYQNLHLLMWFWLTSLAFLSAFSFISTSVLILSPQSKVTEMEYIVGFKLHPRIENFINQISFGDFFVLHLIHKNVHFTVFLKILDDLAGIQDTEDDVV